jgi:PAS domain S-box-containing protein
VLINWIAAGLFLGLLLFLSVRRPPRRLWPSLVAFQSFVLLYILGDALTLVSRDLFWERVGIAVLYSGSMPAAAACWLIAIRYAEVQGCPQPRAGPAWVRLPIAATVLAWLGMITNPWHGQFLVPVIGANNQHLWLWYPVVWIGYLLTIGAVVLFGMLAWRTPEATVRRNAVIMAAGISLTLFFNYLSYRVPAPLPLDLTVVGLSLTSVVFLYGSYRTRLFSLLPIAALEILRHDPDGIVLASPTGRLLYANPAALDLLELESPDPELNAFSVLSRRLRNAEGQGLEAGELALFLGRQSAAAEGGTFRLADDGERWFRVQLTPIPSRRQPVVALSLRLSDVSEQQRAASIMRHSHDELERRVRARTDELRASEERYRTVSELSSDVSFGFLLKRDGSIADRWITSAITHLTGFEPEELDAEGWEAQLHPEDRQRVREVIWPPVEGEARETVFRIRTRDGKLRWLELHAAAADRTPDGAMQIVGAVRDVTEPLRAEVERRSLERQVQEIQRLESLGFLAGGIAHDFNNLLAVVLGNSAIALQEIGKPSHLRRRIERIRSAGKVAAKLTDQMLTYAGRSTPKMSALDLESTIGEVLDLLHASGPPKCELVTELEKGLPPVAGDATQIHQVVVNLVTNAREAIGKAGGTVSLRTGRVAADRAYLSDAIGSARIAPGEYLYLEVSDDGPGMDEEVRRRIFEPFFSTRFSGRGLGLAVVFGIVRAHSGAIKLTSARGTGTTFRILLPSAEQPLEEAEAGRAPATAVAQGATVLVVDDDEAVLEIADLFLARAGFRVQVASGGEEAIAIFAERAEQIDAAVLDLSMPGVDGHDVLRAIRRRIPDLPVILTSGFSQKMAMGQFDASEQPAAFLQKPYEAEELIERLRRVLAEPPECS